MELTSGCRRGGLLRLVPVPLHQTRATVDDLARLADARSREQRLPRCGNQEETRDSFGLERIDERLHSRKRLGRCDDDFGPVEERRIDACQRGDVEQRHDDQIAVPGAFRRPEPV